MLGPRRNGHARAGYVAGAKAAVLLFPLLQTAAGQCCSTVLISGTGSMGGHFQQVTPSEASRSSGMPS